MGENLAEELTPAKFYFSWPDDRPQGRGIGGLMIRRGCSQKHKISSSKRSSLGRRACLGPDQGLLLPLYQALAQGYRHASTQAASHVDAYNLLCRVSGQHQDVQRYGSDPNIEVSNNEGERDLRIYFGTFAGAMALCHPKLAADRPKTRASGPRCSCPDPQREPLGSVTSCYAAEIVAGDIERTAPMLQLSQWTY
jgi:hypothetical protein